MFFGGIEIDHSLLRFTSSKYIFRTFFSIFIVDFEQVNASWALSWNGLLIKS